MAPRPASAQRRTRWIQGSIIATSAVVIISATVNIAGRTAQPTGQTTPVVTSAPVFITTTMVSVQPAAPIDLPTTAEQPVPVVAPATVEAPPTTTAAAQPVVVTYENCAAVWAAIGGPIHRGDPGYSADLDTDDDGTGCEHRPR